jgi:hypothetical protein
MLQQPEAQRNRNCTASGRRSAAAAGPRISQQHTVELVAGVATSRPPASGPMQRPSDAPQTFPQNRESDECNCKKQSHLEYALGVLGRASSQPPPTASPRAASPPAEASATIHRITVLLQLDAPIKVRGQNNSDTRPASERAPSPPSQDSTRGGGSEDAGRLRRCEECLRCRSPLPIGSLLPRRLAIPVPALPPAVLILVCSMQRRHQRLSRKSPWARVARFAAGCCTAMVWLEWRAQGGFVSQRSGNRAAKRLQAMLIKVPAAGFESGGAVAAFASPQPGRRSDISFEGDCKHGQARAGRGLGGCIAHVESEFCLHCRLRLLAWRLPVRSST